MNKTSVVSQTELLIMSLGDCGTEAMAVAQACGGVVRPYDEAALAVALKGGQTAVVVWTDVGDGIAQALRLGQVPTARVAAWAQAVAGVLRVFGRHRRKLLLIEAQVLVQADPQAVQAMARRLALTAPLVPAAPQDKADLAAVIAALVTPQLAGVQELRQELLASSLTVPRAAFAGAALDDLAQGLAGQARLQADLTDRHRRETGLQRAIMADLTEALTATQTAATDPEITLLRDQLAAVTALLNAAQAAAAGPETTLLRNQLADLTEALNATQTAATDPEITLLRDQLAALTALLTVAPPVVVSPGAGHAVIEAAFARLLTDLTDETALRRRAEQDLIALRQTLGRAPANRTA